MTTRTEALEEADKTRAREIEREERNLLYNVRHAKTDEDRRRATAALDVWQKHVKGSGW